MISQQQSGAYLYENDQTGRLHLFLYQQLSKSSLYQYVIFDSLGCDYVGKHMDFSEIEDLIERIEMVNFLNHSYSQLQEQFPSLVPTLYKHWINLSYNHFEVNCCQQVCIWCYLSLINQGFFLIQ